MRKKNKGFTLVELMIVIAILAILAAIVIFALNPAELFKRARDGQRLSDLRVLASAVSFYLADATTPILDGNTNTLCSGGSGADTLWATNTVAGVVTGYANSASAARGIDATGWIKINFNASSSTPIGQLPIDPVNAGATGTPSTMYVFGCDSTLNYELMANMESASYKTRESTDGGDAPLMYEIGTKIIQLLPSISTFLLTND